MNNEKLKGTGSSFGASGQRTIGSGKLKLPKKDVQTIASGSKKPFLKEYTLAMESKLQSLKQKINEKKKQKPTSQQQMKTQKQSTQIEKFLKPKTTKQSSKQLQQKLILSQLQEFLIQNTLLIHKSLLLENHIDSLEILAEATQKELQEIGIPKGHALKLKVNINKLMASKRPGTGEKGKISQIRDSKTKDTDRNKSFVSIQNKANKRPSTIKNFNEQMQSICIGTQQDGMESITFVTKNNNVKNQREKSKFCLFCYQSIKRMQNALLLDFCSQDCEDRYNQMFKTYENNLIKAQNQFMKKPQQQIIIDKDENDRQNEEFELFDQIDEGYQDFDYERYEEMKRELGGF